MNGTFIALMAAIGGGALVKLIEIFFIPKSTREDFAYKLREELRADIKDIKQDKEKLEKESDEWKLKYYELLDKYSILNGKYNDLIYKHEALAIKLDVESKK